MNKLKEIRVKNNISQELLACKVGVTVRYIAFLESGARKPSIDMAFRIGGCRIERQKESFLTLVAARKEF